MLTYTGKSVKIKDAFKKNAGNDPPRTPMFRPLAIDGGGVTLRIDSDRKRR